MKHVKILAIAAVAAMAMMAVAATSASASAKVCSTAGKGAACLSGHGNEYTGSIDASLKTGTSAVLTATNSSGSTVSTVTCTASTVTGEVTSPSTGTGFITGMTFGTCSSPACFNGVDASTTASPTNKWHTTVTTTTPGVQNTNGTMDVKGVNGKFICTGSVLFGFDVTCEYESTEAQADVTGSDTAPEVVATNVPLTRKAGLEGVCGTKGDWSGTYRITTPSSLFIE